MKTVGKLEYKIDVSSEEVQELIKTLGDIYQESLTELLLDLYHKLCNDQLCLEDLQSYADRFGVDLEELYMERVIGNLDAEDEDE